MEEQNLNTSGIAALIKAGRATATGIHVPSIDHAKPFIVLRGADGEEQIQYLDEQFGGPHHAKGTIQAQDEKSFLYYFNLYKSDESLIYASLEPATITGVFNEHLPDWEPGWRDHRVVMVLGHSKEWQTWTKRNGAASAFKGTVEFAEWLEDQLPDIVYPPSGEFMETILAFKVQEQVTFKQHSRLSDGQIQFIYDHIVEGQTSRGGKEARIPEKFIIEVPVFHGLEAKKYQVEARFRYRVHGGAITLWYDLVRPHKVVEQAFKDIWAKVETDSGKQILLGRPE